MKTTVSQFETLARQMLNERLARNPEEATWMGIHTWDDRLGDPSRDKIHDDLRWFGDWIKKLEALSSSSLCETDRMDLSLLRHCYRLERLYVEELRPFEKNPDALDGIGSILFLMLLRDYAPLDQRLISMAHRIRAIPDYLRVWQSRIRGPVKLWTELAIETVQRFPQLLEAVTDAAKSASPAVGAEVRQAIESIQESLTRHRQWLQTVLVSAKAPWAIGTDHFKYLIECRELGMTVEQIEELGRRALSEMKKQREKIAQKIAPGAPLDTVIKQVKRHHPPTFEASLDVYRQVMEETKTFIRRKDLATLPDDDELKIVPTPSFMRPLMPFAAYFSPAAFDPHPVGIYIVTPPEKPEQMLEHSYASIYNTTVHEGYPGHHLQLTTCRKTVGSARMMVDLFHTATEMVEGWAHYCETMMKEEGFGNSLETQLIQVNDGIWRACRILLDISLSRGAMTVEQGVEFLVSETGMDRTCALAEVHRYTQAPGYVLSYLVGKHQFLNLREELRRAWGSGFSLRRFHDAVLRAGSIPLTYLRREMLQADLRHET